MRVIALYFLIAMAATNAVAQSYGTVSPSATDSNITQINGQHIVLTPEGLAQDLLLITIGGTNSTPDEFLNFQKAASLEGYHVLGIDYPNHVMTTVCRQNPDQACFDKFRNEIVFGVPVSAVTEVNRSNCIVNRIEMLLKYLIKNEPEKNWAQYFNGGEIQWSKVVLAGHSQGSGHAAYLAKLYQVERAILIAGPQDVSIKGSAAWIKDESKTPRDRFVALLHEQDPFNTDWQIQVMRELVRDPKALVTKFDDDIPLLASGQIFVSRAKTTNPHTALLTRTYEKAWAFLLRLSRRKHPRDVHP